MAEALAGKTWPLPDPAFVVLEDDEAKKDKKHKSHTKGKDKEKSHKHKGRDSTGSRRSSTNSRK